ncbi:hypothetical protein DES36_1086 [Alkalibaculum bacchi]|jgi:hypothetical protein|uniref:Uncharacterized protein n=1 Tax=Alkalibaculum bacchi TaxID=645887 RepID=A0A366I6F9_9FIRM|nr:hypothetical protein DES36_1086 [Alkalibaculum bacchi]
MINREQEDESNRSLQQIEGDIGVKMQQSTHCALTMVMHSSFNKFLIIHLELFKTPIVIYN